MILTVLMVVEMCWCARTVYGHERMMRSWNNKRVVELNAMTLVYQSELNAALVHARNLACLSNLVSDFDWFVNESNARKRPLMRERQYLDYINVLKMLPELKEMCKTKSMLMNISIFNKNKKEVYKKIKVFMCQVEEFIIRSRTAIRFNQSEIALALGEK
ncbi:hypothetical protein ECANGB1_791 [Enterospora canceri]|uniref:Uncharacterized protein n=1 Tax=Enterospora canceri TaxID=1081671 RepID=A0A1Y1S7E5_9MICR|nr:hypothetical protein ECANGB1_791 [Enterospora canceri]